MEALKKYGFWIGVVLAAIAAVVTHFVLIVPMETANQELWNKLNERRKKLQEYADRTDFKNDAWIEFEKKRAEVWRDQKARCEEYLHQEDPFQSEFRDGKGNVISSRSVWVSAFRQSVDKMIRRLRKSGIAVGDTVFKCQSQAAAWEDFHPRVPELRTATREFHIQEEFSKILEQKSLRLARIDHVHIGDATAAILKDIGRVEHEGLFTTRAYEISVVMDFEQVLYLFKAMLGSKRLMLSIERIRVSQIALAAPDLKRPNLVQIVVRGRYMDFSVAKKKAASS